jgi:hypothetical protein
MVSKQIKDAFVRWHTGYYGDGQDARDMVSNEAMRAHYHSAGLGNIIERWDRDLKIFAAGFRSGRRSSSADGQRS